MAAFDPQVVTAVLAHMNGDHVEDNLVIARAHGFDGASSATMTGIDAEAGTWSVQDPAGRHELRAAWPGGPISERPEIRREVVAVFEAAAATLGLEQREH